MFDRMTSYGNGNKSNLRVAMLENLLQAHQGEGGSARVNSLKQVIKRSKSEMASDAPSSLDLMRIIFQNEITRELHQIMERHVRTTFSPAIENLKKNGHDVDDDVINDLYISILEAAKKPYLRKPAEPTPKEPEIEVIAATSQPFVDSANYHNRKRCGTNSSELSAHGEGTTRMDQVRKVEEQHQHHQLQQQQLQQQQQQQQQSRFQVDLSPYTTEEVAKWNPERFGLTTLFIPATKVAALTFQTMTALFAQNSRMFRYSCDAMDKTTLQNDVLLVPEAGRCYLVCLDDARELVGRSQELEQAAFCLKEPMILKIRRFAGPFYLRLRQRTAQQMQQQSPWNFTQ